MLTRVVSLVTLLFIPMVSMGAETPVSTNYYALVIGDDEYKNLTNLKTAQNDAVAVERLLRERYGFETELLLNATRDDIIKSLSSFRSTLTDSDDFLLYYAGHGFLDEDSEQGYWLPIDADRNNPANWVSNNDITSQLKAMASRHVLVVADSCYAGTLTRAATEADLTTGVERRAWLKRMWEMRSRTALTSGGLEPVVDTGGGRHSVFARAFLMALRKNLEILVAQELYDRIKGPVAANADQTPGYGTIHKAGDQGGDFIFVPADIRFQVKGSEPIETAFSGSGESSQEMERLFWETIKSSEIPAEFEEYLKQFPDGTFSGLARLKIKGFTWLAEPSDTVAAPSAPVLPPAQDSGTTEITAQQVTIASQSAAVPAFRPLVAGGVDPNAYRVGDTFKDCDLCPEMVVIPAGVFMMGSPSSQEGNYDQEGPLHRVTFEQEFAIGKYETRRAEFKVFVQETGYESDGGCYYWASKKWGKDLSRNWQEPGFDQTDQDPVVCVSWNDSKAYVDWLSSKTGNRYLLPSEAEWEYSARAGTTTRYWWGDAVGRENANCDGCGIRWGDARTTPVGSFGGNPFGLHDTSGNVWEWVEDCWSASYSEAPVDGSALVTDECRKRQQRSLRGGSWSYEPPKIRTAVRGWGAAAVRLDDVGFRVARKLID